MVVDAYTMYPHFLWHIAPVFLALPEEIRGQVYVDSSIPEMVDINARLGLPLAAGRLPYRGFPEPVIMAGGSETQWAASRPVILIEHGAGQTYSADMDSAAYSGGFGRDAVVLFLCPNETVAARNRARYPDAQAVAVGAPHLNLNLYYRSTVARETSRVVAVTFHHDFRGIPETRNAFDYYADAILHLTHTHRLLGHAHPREQWKILPWYKDHGIESTPHFVDVLQRADLLVVDNSSTGLEMAAMGHPIVWLNAPYYRRDVHHGGRFWEWTEMAVTIDGPGQLADAIELAFLDPPDIRAARERWVAKTYVAYGTEAAEAAVAAILPFVV